MTSSRQNPKFVDRSVEAVRVDHFEQLVVVAIIDVHADEYWTIAVIQGSLEDGRDLLIIPLAPNASAYLTTSTGPKSMPDGRPYFCTSCVRTMSYVPSIQTM
jgi:hypothetical protein